MPETRRIETNGFMTSYLDTGPGAAGTVMLGHSHFSDHRMWQPQIEALSRHYRVVAYDLRGHGATDAPEGACGLSDLAGDARALMDGLGIERAHFAGLSLGGMIAMAFALDAPERLCSLLLCDTAAEMPRSVWDERIETARREGLGPLVEPTMTRWFTSGFRERSPEAVAQMRDIAANTSLAGYVGCAEAIRTMRLADRLREIRLPTRVIVGADDPATPVSSAKLIAERIAGADLVVIDDAAHLANLEQPEAFSRAMVEFLDAVGMSREAS